MKKSIATGAKRGSVGILILKALSGGDKYGYEIIKEVEDKSAGEYILKQPSLYSSLKRMEVSGLITSYWEDSDIGGRRHYYNLTEKGLQKLSTSKFQWQDNQGFITEMFSEKNSSAKPKAIDKQISTVTTPTKKTVTEKPKEKIITVDKTSTVSIDVKKEPLIEKPIKKEDSFILPTINPMQQDMFSIVEKKNTTKNITTNKTSETIKLLIADIDKEEEKINKLETVTKATSMSENNNAVKNKKGKVNKSKYTKLKATYFQMPLFEKSATASPTTPITIPLEEEIPKTQIEHIKSVASNSEFSKLKEKLGKNKKSFLEKEDGFKTSYNYKVDTNLENSDSLYGSFDLKDDLESAFAGFDFNAEETSKPTAIHKFNNLGVDEEETITTEIKKEETIKETIQLEDDVDYKQILGELCTENDEGILKDTTTKFSKQELPRLGKHNINVTLNPSNNGNNNSTYKLAETQSPFAKDPTVDKKIASVNTLTNTQTLNDEYSDSLLQDTYLDGIKVRVHKKQAKSIKLSTNYVSINKLNASLSLFMFIIMLIQISVIYLQLNNSGYIIAQDNYIFIGAIALSFLPTLLMYTIYLTNSSKKQELHYSLTNSLTNNFIVMLIGLVFIYAVNVILGMTSLNQMDFIVTWLLPGVLLINLLISPIVKFMLLKRKSYYY